jgi:hypothetical protein
MRVYAAVFALCVIAAVLTSEPCCGSEQYQESSAASWQSTTPAVGAEKNHSESANEAAALDKHPPSWCTALKKPEWWLVIIAALTGFAIAYQAREMTRATNVMQGQMSQMQRQVTEMSEQTTLLGQYVNATNRLVDNTVRSDRAWVIPEVVPMAKRKANRWHRWIGGGKTEPMSAEDILKGEHLRHGLKFINMGRTVAHISAYEFHCGFSDYQRKTLQIDRISYNEDFNRMLQAGAEVLTDDVIDIHGFVKRLDAHVVPPFWDNWIVVLVSVTYDHVFSGDSPEKELFRFVFNLTDQVMRRVATQKEDEQQIGKREIDTTIERPI